MSSQCHADETNSPPDELSDDDLNDDDLYRHYEASQSEVNLAYEEGFYKTESTLATYIKQTDAKSGSDVPVSGTVTAPVQGTITKGNDRLDSDTESPHRTFTSISGPVLRC